MCPWKQIFAQKLHPYTFDITSVVAVGAARLVTLPVFCFCLQGNRPVPPTKTQQQVRRQHREIQRGQIHKQQNQEVHPGQHVSVYLLK